MNETLPTLTTLLKDAPQLKKVVSFLVFDLMNTYGHEIARESQEDLGIFGNRNIFQIQIPKFKSVIYTLTVEVLDGRIKGSIAYTNPIGCNLGPTNSIAI